MKIIEMIEIVKLNKNGVRVEEQANPLPFLYFNDDGSLPKGNYDKTNVAGTWVIVDGRCEIGTFAYRRASHRTLVKEEDLRKYLISELEKNCVDVDENWELKELADRYNELAQLKNNEKKKEILEKLLKRALAEVDKEMDRTGFINDSGDIPDRYFFDSFIDDYLGCFSWVEKELVENELVPEVVDFKSYNKKREEIEKLTDKLLDMVKEQVKIKYKSYSLDGGRRCYYKTKKDLISWCVTTFLPATEDMSLREEYEWFINEFGDIEVTLEEYALLTRGIDPDELEDYL
jgi:hypothetical protein